MNVPFRVCVYFAAAPDEALSTADVAAKFNIDKKAVQAALRRPVSHGYLAVVPGKVGRGGAMNEYRAGPLLLRMLGRAA